MPSVRLNPQVVWDKVQKEVAAGRVCGPFEKAPFEHFYSSPLGLVPNAGQIGKFRLIFNLSAGDPISINGGTTWRYHSMEYNDLDKAVQLTQKLGVNAKLGKSDLEAVIRQVPIHPDDWPLLVFRATNPETKLTYFFFDKCLPFGSCESCQIYQRVSNGLAWAVRQCTGKPVVNYLDDFLFGDICCTACNSQILTFLDVCLFIGFPVSEEKTEWSKEWVIFLGLLIHGRKQLICLSEEKLAKGLTLLRQLLHQRKATIRQLMTVAGFLNFLTRALNFGRQFLWRVYDLIGALQTKPRWHFVITAEVKADMKMWEGFLSNSPPYKTFVEFLETPATEVGWFTDASRSPDLGFGCFFNGRWMFQQWPPGLISDTTSTCFLELLVVTISVAKWASLIAGKRIQIHCDNQATVQVMNNLTSGCKLCMILVRNLVENCLMYNCRIR